MKQFFNPKTIAFIGATDRVGSVGYGISKNLIKSTGRLFFVNNSNDKVFGRKCYKSILNIKERIDLVVIAIPAKYILSVVKECKEKKVRGVIIISAGFSEKGNSKLEKEVIDILGNIPLLGPNCLGVLTNRFNASFSPSFPKKGEVAFVSQSGAILDAMLTEDIGFSKMISYGNGAKISISDIINYLEKDPKTKAISIYIEGIKNGKEFIDSVKRCTKPIIILKGGREKKSRKFIESHTASISGQREIYSAVFRENNVFEVETYSQLVNSIKAISEDVIKENISVITNSGAQGIMIYDWCEYYRVRINNPIDILGDATPDRYEKEIEKQLKDKNVGGLVVGITEQSMTNSKEIIKRINQLKKKYGKSIIGCFMIKDKTHNIYNHKEPKVIALVLKLLLWKAKFKV